jgi:hypothetical protein
LIHEFNSQGSDFELKIGKRAWHVLQLDTKVYFASWHCKMKKQQQQLFVEFLAANWPIVKPFVSMYEY